MSYISPKCNGTISFVYLKCGGRIFTIFGRSDFNVFSYKKWTLVSAVHTAIFLWICFGKATSLLINFANSFGKQCTCII